MKKKPVLTKARIAKILRAAGYVRSTSYAGMIRGFKNWTVGYDFRVRPTGAMALSFNCVSGKNASYIAEMKAALLKEGILCDTKEYNEKLHELENFRWEVE